MKEEIKLNRNTMIVSETNEKGIIVYANDDFCSIAGYTKDELIGQPHNMVRHPDMPKAAFEDLWKTIQSGNVWKGIVKNKTKNGDFYWVNATAYPSKTHDGKIRYISVRVSPTQDEIRNAEFLYKSLK
ncbi:PAS sensor-containing signal transduction protein [Arcobacter venerupis]|jgi:PAS domain S-box-containing protein|uniref:PAS sensor-containing signal transduction protein n=1 Tax=Arcobacter venerupis TaxID=1054033 RepID=A0AAE7B5X3_9BACT|nr:PAS domain-containing protein [Arcobacter venerupis]QKF65641.1 PAS sensor-containing signal transduction protein [Arcobacter venerupis]RWS50153.1 PAS sensor domain-containing protein [Arcobacter venerupis]